MTQFPYLYSRVPVQIKLVNTCEGLVIEPEAWYVLISVYFIVMNKSVSSGKYPETKNSI